MTFQDLVQWWNLIYALPFSAALLQTLLQATGAMHFGHGHGLHIGHHVPHADHHLHIGHHTHIGHDAHPAPHGAVTHGPHDRAVTRHSQAQPGAHSAEHYPGIGTRFFEGFMGLLGVGRVPFMIVLSSFLMIWGLAGLIINHLLEPALKFPGIFILPSMGISFASATGLTGLLARGIGKIIPSTETYVCSEFEQIGRFAKALTQIDETRGKVALLDQQSNRIEMQVRIEDGEIIPSGTRVVIARYDADLQQFIVRRDPTTALESGPSSGSNPQHRLTSGE